MSRRHSLILFLASAVFLTGAPTAAHAQHQWVPAGAGSWHVAANWSTGTVPTAANGVGIQNGGTSQVGAAAACSTVDLGGGSGSGNLEINAGGALTCTEVRVANTVSGNTGTLTVQGGGKLIVTSFFNTGSNGTATLTVTGAGSRISSAFGINLGNGFSGNPSVATMNVLAGGEVVAPDIRLGTNGATSTLNVGTGGIISANITNQGSGSTVNFNHTDNITFARTLSAARLNKSGSGSLTLTGTANANMTVSEGSLFLNGTHASSPITLTGGLLGGTGTVGTITASGGTVSPGLSPGILTSGAVSLGAASTFFVELDGATVGSGYDQLNATGGVTLSSPTLSGTAGATHPAGTTFVIIDNVSAGTISGTFSGLPEASLVTLSGQTFAISYIGGDGNDVTLTAGTAVPSLPLVGLLALATIFGGLGYVRLRAGA